MAQRSVVRLLSTFVLFTLAFLPSTAYAQNQAQYGVLVGINSANVDFTAGDPESFNPDFESRTGLVAGLTMAWDSTRNIGFQVDALFSQKGAKATITDDGETFDFDVKLNYLEIPLLVRGNMRASDDATFHVFAGPTLGFKLSDETRIDDVEVSDDEAGDFKSFDAGLAVGARMQIRQLLLDARYTWGLVNVLDEDEDGEEVKNRAFTFMVGFSFN